MQYVFFDIECACVYRDTAKICAFGYCLTDEQFNILEKADLLINPKGKFHLTDGSGKDGIVLPYEYRDFKKYPLFSEFYPKIRDLLQSKNHRVFGHATTNDVKYLNLETRRYHIPALSYEFFDTQLIYMSIMNSFDRQIGLEGVAQALGVEFTPHRAADDAFATMKVAQAMCEREGVSMEELLKRYGVLPGKTAKGNIVNGNSVNYTLYQEQRRAGKEERIRQHEAFCRLIEKVNGRKSNKAGAWHGKVFSFSHEIEHDFVRAKGYMEEISRNGGRYSTKVSNCNVYVRAEEDNGRRLLNAQRAQVEIWEESELKTRCALTEIR